MDRAIFGIYLELWFPLPGHDKCNICMVDSDGVIVSTGNSTNHLHRVKDMSPFKNGDGRYVPGVSHSLEILTKDSIGLMG